MLWIGKLEERLNALGNRMDMLQAELQEAMARTAVLAARLEAAEHRMMAEQARYEDQSRLSTRLADAIERLDGMAAEQAAALMLYEAIQEKIATENERRDLALEQLRIDLIGTRLQAERDLTEMREINHAVAASVLLKKGVTNKLDG